MNMLEKINRASVAIYCGCITGVIVAGVVSVFALPALLIPITVVGGFIGSGEVITPDVQCYGEYGVTPPPHVAEYKKLGNLWKDSVVTREKLEEEKKNTLATTLAMVLIAGIVIGTAMLLGIQSSVLFPLIGVTIVIRMFSASMFDHRVVIE